MILSNCDTTYEPPSKKAKEDSSEKENIPPEFTSKCSINELTRLESTYINLITALKYEQRNEVIVQGMSQKWGDKSPSIPYDLVRTLSKTTAELLENLDLNREDKYWKTVANGVTTAAKIFDAFSVIPSYAFFTYLNTGIEYVTERIVIFLMVDCNNNILSLERGNIVQKMMDQIKSLKLRHVITEKLLIGFSTSLKRLSDDKICTSTPKILKISDVTTCFRLLQMVEHILFTTQKEPWIEEDLYKKLGRLRDRVIQNGNLGQVLVFMDRLVLLAKPLLKLQEESSTDSD